jgi:hypothetical protein
VPITRERQFGLARNESGEVEVELETALSVRAVDRLGPGCRRGAAVVLGQVSDGAVDRVLESRKQLQRS